MEIVLDGVMETLLITLYARAKDATSANPFIGDKKSLEIINQLDYDFSKFEKGKGSYFGVLARVSVMDKVTRAFIQKYPNAKIVSLGCGLDTRFERVDNGQIEWYNLDFPEVMEKRKLFFEENPRVINLPFSALDEIWTKEIKSDDRELLILSEGVLMYLTEEQVKSLLNLLTANFSSFTAYFDLCHKVMIKQGKRHDTVKHTKTEFHFGVVDGSELVALEPKLKQIGLINFSKEMKKQKMGMFRIFMPIISRLNNRLGMYTYGK